MSKRAWVCAALLFLPAAEAGAGSLPPVRDSGPVLGDSLDAAIDGAVRPAYRLVEGVSDGLYDLVRVHLVSSILPSRLNRKLSAAPGRDSALLFSRNLRRRQARFCERMRESYPDEQPGSAKDPVRMREWRARVMEGQSTVALDALADTLLQRYGLEPFGRQSERYARDSRNWEPGFLATAGLVGGAIVYVNGLRASVPAGNWRLRLDLRPGRALERALRSGGTVRGLAGVELGRRDGPLTLAAEFGAAGGRLRGESVGLKYRIRY